MTRDVGTEAGVVWAKGLLRIQRRRPGPGRCGVLHHLVTVNGVCEGVSRNEGVSHVCAINVQVPLFVQ